ncbi:MAG: isochorismatase family protein, partial [Candidatus Saccharimonadales bacterium]
PGSQLHPDLLVEHQPGHATRFIKGDAACQSPDEDTSYTGALAHNPDMNALLPDWLRSHDVNDIYVAGLALGDGGDNKLCVDSTATDLQDQGFDVTVITDATEAVIEANKQLCLRRLGERGIRLMTTAQVIDMIEAQL